MWIIKNRRNFLLQVYSLTLLTVLVIMILRLMLDPSYKLVVLATLTILLTGGLIGVIKNYRIGILAHFYVISLYLALVCYASITGGVEAPAATWFLLCPLVSILTLPISVSRFWLGMVIFTLIAFYLFKEILILDSFNGGRYWYLLSYLFFFLTAYRIISILYEKVRSRNEKLEQLNRTLQQKQEDLLASQHEIMLQHDLLKVAEHAAVKKNRKLESHLNQLLEISRMEELHNGSLQYAMQTLQSQLLKTLEVDSVGVWYFDEHNKELKLISSATTHNKSIDEPSVMKKKDAPHIFELLEAGTVLRMPENEHDLKELKMTDGRNGFKSMIGCPYFIEGKFAGFIGCKSNNYKKWSTEDIIFTRAISDALSLSFKSHQRKKQHSELEEKQLYIEELNESLEEKVLQRTAELEIKNQQLSNFAFINAHKIRGPVCRLLGMNNLLLHVKEPKEIMLLRDYLSISIKELDEITRQATKVLADNNLMSEKI